MRLLLDTHIALWAIADHASLSGKARRLIDDPDNEIVISTATIWEIAAIVTKRLRDFYKGIVLKM